MVYSFILGVIIPDPAREDAFPPDFKQSSLDDLNGMVGNLVWYDLVVEKEADPAILDRI
jgi:hypothetical protein